MNVSFPLIFTGGKRLGRTYYPKRLGKILIYIADHSFYSNGNINRIVLELSLTFLHEITHVFHEGRTKKYHDCEQFFYNLIGEIGG